MEEGHPWRAGGESWRAGGGSLSWKDKAAMHANRSHTYRTLSHLYSASLSCSWHDLRSRNRLTPFREYMQVGDCWHKSENCNSATTKCDEVRLAERINCGFKATVVLFCHIIMQQSFEMPAIHLLSYTNYRVNLVVCLVTYFCFSPFRCSSHFLLKLCS